MKNLFISGLVIGSLVACPVAFATEPAKTEQVEVVTETTHQVKHKKHRKHHAKKHHAKKRHCKGDLCDSHGKQGKKHHKHHSKHTKTAAEKEVEKETELTNR